VWELREYLEARDPPQRLSCRVLAEQGIVHAGASSMWRALAIYRMACEHPELFEYRHLGVAHMAILLKAREPLRLALLRRAERRQWSKSQLARRLDEAIEQQRRGVNPLVQFAEELGDCTTGARTPGAPGEGPDDAAGNGD
jgi:hypothetical protein